MKKIKELFIMFMHRALRGLCNTRGEMGTPKGVPKNVIEAFAKHFLPKIQKHFQNPENQKAFELWKKEREETNKKGKLA